MYAVVPSPSPSFHSTSMSSQLLEALGGLRAFRIACSGVGLDHPGLEDLGHLERALECDLMDRYAGHLSDHDLSRLAASLAADERRAEQARSSILATTDPATHMAILLGIAAGARPGWELESELSARREDLARGQADHVLPLRQTLAAGLRPLSRTGVELIARALSLTPSARRLDTEALIAETLIGDLQGVLGALEPEDRRLLTTLLAGPLPSAELDGLILSRLHLAGLCFESLRGPERVVWVPEELIEDLGRTLHT